MTDNRVSFDVAFWKASRFCMIISRHRLFPGWTVDALSRPHSTSAACSLQQFSSSGMRTGLLDVAWDLPDRDSLGWKGIPFDGGIIEFFTFRMEWYSCFLALRVLCFIERQSQRLFSLDCWPLWNVWMPRYDCKVLRMFCGRKFLVWITGMCFSPVRDWHFHQSRKVRFFVLWNHSFNEVPSKQRIKHLQYVCIGIIVVC